ncbi:hypothetical protein D0Y65_003768 [Glycine soja]|uniref:Uncharacterized protein n=1 Tax=Glycine soja TaxID=3848 RepID=A0A445LNB1_GLYSO|nr:hypothetical protein D0Y65_003768 [Glycine soja]
MKHGRGSSSACPVSDSHRTPMRVRLRCDAVSVAGAVTGRAFLFFSCCLVFLPRKLFFSFHSNLRLLSRNTPQYHQEETKMWDVAGDDFGSLDDCGILEIASLSLDEPELEGVFFNDDG